MFFFFKLYQRVKSCIFFSKQCRVFNENFQKSLQVPREKKLIPTKFSTQQYNLSLKIAQMLRPQRNKSDVIEQEIKFRPFYFFLNINLTYGLKVLTILTTLTRYSSQSKVLTLTGRKNHQIEVSPESKPKILFWSLMVTMFK